MKSHSLLLVLFALLVAPVFAVLLRDDPRAQLRTAALMFGAFLAAGFVLAWILYPMPF